MGFIIGYGAILTILFLIGLRDRLRARHNPNPYEWY